MNAPSITAARQAIRHLTRRLDLTAAHRPPRPANRRLGIHAYTGRRMATGATAPARLTARLLLGQAEADAQAANRSTDRSTGQPA